MLGGNQWLLLYEGDDALPLDDAGGLVLPGDIHCQQFLQADRATFRSA